MAGPEEHIRRMQAPDPKMTSWKAAPSKAPAKAMTSWTKATAPSNGSSASSAKPAYGREVRGDAANDFRGQPQIHMEIKGACLYVHPQGGSSPVPAGGDSKIDGNTNAAEANIFEIEMTQDLDLDFDWQGFDAMDGSQRENMEIRRCLYMTLIVKHNGFKLTLPSGIKWHEGEPPDLTPQKGATTTSPSGETTVTPPESEHVINLFAIRRGLFAEATTRIFGGLWGSNMRDKP